jgi:choline dehydrogenase-like flavoprotein
MGLTPDEGVTDANMLVFGTKNLYVCSNAVFPTCAAVNPTLTLTAMSMRLGDHLVADGPSIRKEGTAS